MKQMSWEDYYDGFYDWSPSTRKSYTYRLSHFGPAEEVLEIAQELAYHDSTFGARFLEKALNAGVRFSPNQVLEMVGTVDRTLLGRMAEATDVPFDQAELQEIWGLIDDDTFRRISRRAGINVLDETDSTDSTPCYTSPDPPREKRKGRLISFLESWLLYSALDRWLHRRDRDGR